MCAESSRTPGQSNGSKHRKDTPDRSVMGRKGGGDTHHHTDPGRDGDIDRFFPKLPPGQRGTPSSKMAAARSAGTHEASMGASSQRSSSAMRTRQRATSPPESDAGSVHSDCRSPESHRSYAGWDLEAYIKALPTRHDFEACVQRMERSYKQEISELRRDVTDRLEEVERSVEETVSTLQAHDAILNDHTAQIQQLMLSQDDQENRARRNNIRVRGLPETVESKDLASVVIAIFNGLLQKDKEAIIELDRVHRALGPKNPNINYPRDVICRVHFFAVKDAIMQAARAQDSILFEETRIHLLPDVSKLTLDLRRALKPLTGALQAKQIKYHWGFPFQLSASHDGKSAVFRTLGDLPKFLGTFELPMTSLPDWPLHAANPGFQPSNSWKKQTKKPKPKRPRPEASSSTSAG